MPNGKPGDHPITDIVLHGLPVYSDSVDELVRELVRLGGQPEYDELGEILAADFPQYRQPELARLETFLRQRLGRMRSERTDAT